MQRNLLRDAIVLALFAATAGSAMAQTAQPATTTNTDEKSLDTVTVTGSRIAVPGLTTSSPVMTIDRESIDKMQATTAEEVLRDAPGVTIPIGPGVNNGSGGGAVISLRGFGSNRSLVLIDGRRMVPFNLGGSVDSNTIPVALLSGVDVLTGGASAVYGADAVAGVTNFILRRDFSGVEISASTGQSVPGSDQARRRIDITGGANFADGRGNVSLSVGRTKNYELFQGDRDVGLVSINSRTGLPEGSNTAVPALFTIVGSGTLVNRQLNTTTGLLGPIYQTYNFNPLNYFYTPMDRDQGTFLGRFEFNRHAEAYAQVFHTKSLVQLSLAPSGTFGNTFAVPIGNPYIPDAMRQQICTDRGISAANCVVGNTTMVNMAINRRFTEYGPRLNDIETKTNQYVFGLRGDITDNWRYDAYYSQGKSVSNSARINWGSRSRLAQSLNAVTTTTCVSGASGCVPLNVWGPEGSITPEMLGGLFVTSVSTATVEQKVFSAFVNGDLGEFKSPWAENPIGMAFGVERRDMEAATGADVATQTTAEVLGTGAPTPNRRGSFTINEAYIESIIPLISGKTAFNALNLELAYRRSKFETSSNTGSSYGTWKYGLSWSPIEDLTLRGMFQRAVRAPSINELFAPIVTGLSNLANDPCAGAQVNQAQANTAGTLSNLCRQTGVPVNVIGVLPQPNAGQINTRSGGNLQLGPEVANTRTFGVVFQPSFIKNFAVTLDYWQINLTSAISGPTVGDVLNACYDPAQNAGLTMNAACAVMGRDPATGTFNGAPAAGILLPLSNLGKSNARGYDLGVNYSLDIGAMGRLDFNSQSTWMREYRSQPTPTSVDRSCLGYYSTDCGFGEFGFKSTFTTTWKYQAIDLSWRARHVSSMELEPGKTGFQPAFSKIPAYTYHDLSFGYRFPHLARLTLTVNNVMNKKPPFVGNTIGTTSTNSGNTFPQVYDVIGRYVTLGVNLKF